MNYDNKTNKYNQLNSTNRLECTYNHDKSWDYYDIRYLDTSTVRIFSNNIFGISK